MNQNFECINSQIAIVIGTWGMGFPIKINLEITVKSVLFFHPHKKVYGCYQRLAFIVG
jgi:hypothetical protein